MNEKQTLTNIQSKNIKLPRARETQCRFKSTRNKLLLLIMFPEYTGNKFIMAKIHEQIMTFTRIDNTYFKPQLGNGIPRLSNNPI